MSKQWTTVIEPRNKLVSLNLKEVWNYRDLITLFVKRDFKTKYKQTVLGPLWFIIQPLFTTIIYSFVFGNIAGLSTDEIIEERPFRSPHHTASSTSISPTLPREDAALPSVWQRPTCPTAPTAWSRNPSSACRASTPVCCSTTTAAPISTGAAWAYEGLS